MIDLAFAEAGRRGDARFAALEGAPGLVLEAGRVDGRVRGGCLRVVRQVAGGARSGAREGEHAHDAYDDEGDQPEEHAQDSFHA